MVSYWKNVSIKKISEDSGYGTATVDRVLNNRPGVSKRTKDKILKTLNNLQMELGKPDEDFKNDKGNLEFVYNTKKYGIVCERRFEVDSNSIVIGFVSNGCF